MIPFALEPVVTVIRNGILSLVLFMDIDFESAMKRDERQDKIVVVKEDEYRTQNFLSEPEKDQRMKMDTKKFCKKGHN